MRNSYPWADIAARAVAAPGRWLQPKELANVPARTAKRIRLRQHPDLRLADGRLEVRAEQKYTDIEGVQRATIWLRYMPNSTDAPRGRMERSADGRQT